MVDTNDPRSDALRLNRRRTLQALGAGVGAVVGLGTFAGSAAAWERNDVDFKGCSEVWIIVSESDINYEPPTVANIIVETEDGGLDCRPKKFTEETTTTIPGQHGDAPVLKYSAASGEKILGVIIYNYSEDHDGINPDSSHPLRENPNRCARTPGTPDPRDADCVDLSDPIDWENDGTYPYDEDIIESRGASGDRGHGNDEDNGNGRGNGHRGGRGNGNGR